MRPCHGLTMLLSRALVVAALSVLPLATTAQGETGAQGEAAELVDVARVVPGLVVDMRYATADNFTGRAVYPCNRCYLAASTAHKLAVAQAELHKRGLRLKAWDCFRPLSVQRTFWSLVPDERYVADPRKGSRHNRGASVDVTVVDGTGRELAMPTPFDDFTPRAAHANKELPAKVLANRETLLDAMQKAGFKPMATEWWHYDDADWQSHGILDVPFEALCGR